MTPVLTLLTAVALGAAWWGIWRVRSALVLTTMLSAWRWGVFAIGAWTVVWIGTVTHLIPGPLTGSSWYTVCILMLCPGIAVLGARRPGAGVWTAFVIVPLIAVLGWPLLTIWKDGWVARSFQLETPHLLGFLLVLIMGAGNYLGTRFSLGAATYVVAVCLAAGTVSAVAPATIQGSLVARNAATMLLGVAVIATRLFSPTLVDAGDPVDRLWREYRDLYGIVWARRFQERMNAIAARQQWPARLEDDGLLWNEDITDDMRCDAVLRIEQSFRWLLRRFVDAQWIDERLTGRSREQTAFDEPSTA